MQEPKSVFPTVEDQFISIKDNNRKPCFFLRIRFTSCNLESSVSKIKLGQTL